MEHRGYTEYQFQTEEDMAKFYQHQTYPLNFPELFLNEYVVLKGSGGEICDRMKMTAEGLKSINCDPIKTEYMGIVKPRNLEQQFAFDLLRDKNTTIKLLTGRFGSGKTYLMTTAAVHALEKHRFDKILYVRNNVQVRDVPDIGFLPGDVNAKLIGYAMPMADALGGLDGLLREIDERRIEIFPLGMIRGRDFKNTLIYVSECENLTTSQVQLIIGRVGEGSSVWFDGDMKQVDKPVFEKNSGLSKMIERLRGHHLFGYVQLQKTERSATAAMADLLD